MGSGVKGGGGKSEAAGVWGEASLGQIWLAPGFPETCSVVGEVQTTESHPQAIMTTPSRAPTLSAASAQQLFPDVSCPFTFCSHPHLPLPG